MQLASSPVVALTGPAGVVDAGAVASSPVVDLPGLIVDICGVPGLFVLVVVTVFEKEKYSK